MNYNAPEARYHAKVPGTQQVLNKCYFSFPSKDAVLL